VQPSCLRATVISRHVAYSICDTRKISKLNVHGRAEDSAELVMVQKKAINRVTLILD